MYGQGSEEGHFWVLLRANGKASRVGLAFLLSSSYFYFSELEEMVCQVYFV